MAGEGGERVFETRLLRFAHSARFFNAASLPRQRNIASVTAPPLHSSPRLSRGGKKVVCGAAAHPPLLLHCRVLLRGVRHSPPLFSKNAREEVGGFNTRIRSFDNILFKRNGVFFKAGWKYNKRNFSTNESDPF